MLIPFKELLAEAQTGGYAVGYFEAWDVYSLEAVLEHEKPAHTDYHLCLIEPRFRVGFQAQVGIDTIVASPAPELTLGEEQALGFATILNDAEDEPSGRIGRRSRVGRGTRLV